MTKELVINVDEHNQIAAKLYTPDNLKGAVMIAPATGIRQNFYANIAAFLMESGYGVITFDNDGIGDSKNGPIKKSKASLVSWGQKDMSAVFSELKAQFPNVKYHLFGHSAGGQLVGLMDGCMELSSIFNYASSSGKLRQMNTPFKYKAYFYMNFFIPINNLLFGYTKSQWVGMGAPLPKQCAKQWSHWCNNHGYIQTYLDAHEVDHYYHDLDCPSLWVNTTDDMIANNENTEEMINVFPKLKVTTKTLDPKEHGLKEIGHMRFFSQRSKKLWPVVLDWIEANN